MSTTHELKTSGFPWTKFYEWAKKTYDEAEEWLRYNSDNCSINGGEDW